MANLADTSTEHTGSKRGRDQELERQAQRQKTRHEGSRASSPDPIQSDDEDSNFIDTEPSESVSIFAEY
jgi:hypothetical protein